MFECGWIKISIVKFNFASFFSQDRWGLRLGGPTESSLHRISWQLYLSDQLIATTNRDRRAPVRDRTLNAPRDSRVLLLNQFCRRRGGFGECQDSQDLLHGRGLKTVRKTAVPNWDYHPLVPWKKTNFFLGSNTSQPSTYWLFFVYIRSGRLGPSRSFVM